MNNCTYYQHVVFIERYPYSTAQQGREGKGWTAYSLLKRDRDVDRDRDGDTHRDRL